MSDIAFELCEDLTTDTLTGHAANKSVFIKSGVRHIYISEASVRKMAEILNIKDDKIYPKP